MKTVTPEQVATPERARRAELPDHIQEALGELAGAAKEGLMALSVGVGLGVLHELMEGEVDEVVGLKGRHDPEREAKRHGHEPTSVTLGARRVAVDRPRVRSADDRHEVPLATFSHFAARDPLADVVLERMLCTLFEAVEMVVVGAVASLLSIVAVLALADLTSLIDSGALALSPGTYIAENAWRSLVVLVTLFALAYGGTWVIAWSIYGRNGDVDPGGSSWWEAFRHASEGRFVRVTVELRDGRRIAGQLGGFTADSVDNRELGLVAPITAQAAPGAPAKDLKDDFVLLREEDVAFIAGRYRDGASSA